MTKGFIRGGVEDRHLRARREQCVPSALRKWNLLMERDRKKGLGWQLSKKNGAS